MEDLHLLDIKADKVTHTSDYFDQIYELAIKMIKIGLAYTDDTDQAQVGFPSIVIGLWTNEIADAGGTWPGHRIKTTGRNG